MNPRRSDRRAFTLFELVLVLALLSVVAAMAWPAIQVPLAQQRMRSAAEEIRTAWMAARAQAMTSGQIQVFRCTLDSGEYFVEAFESLDDLVEASEPLATSGAGAGAKTLPDGIKIVGLAQMLSARDTSAAESGTSGGEGASRSDASDSILFYPDGTTSDVTEFILADDDGRQSTLSMHGLTGIVTIAVGAERMELEDSQ